MKRTLSILLALCLLCAFIPSAMAAYDMTVIRSNEYLEIDVNTDSDAAFIESTFSVKDRSFEHSMESALRYSNTMFDILVLNYSKSSSYPIFRLWLIVNIDSGYQYFNSVTFTIGDKDYTFTDIADSDWYSITEDGVYTQKMLIKFGNDNIDFLVAVEQAIKPYLEAGAADLDQLTIPVVFHGTSDVTTTLGLGFTVEFILFKSAVIDSGVLNYLDQVISTPMTVTNH